ncbi:MAG: saccharopine dehydrogenase [Ignavibacteria bacterium RIFOXYB2_FULL_35_12]|nr:MAG: saccharopine dehydrogenase [Ignavibacteria bacterium GWA2_36_19]OGU62635.1 MAG: saccharopine dehydrogenase [Ignavibacteria bacterium GWF2_35_20]OGU88916.1 MAG: saccharopine dehydrogenase [Ignavibacteria bacterium RIFOXYC12_FULL_35_11]OGU89231.1 MAG: saccharopine dehydrogenase [Ignavibacteria bacterium RIFOXYA12_FULL_35_25]OGU94628.1 MAG: saccharopine dehydrogenase [Ignavibacteria bacterium RIFOXYB12_FULL_35_14]OGV01616.1 MAG: saccharopine dehydrogenase [Ignavibacteria bacterium RIFOXYC
MNILVLGCGLVGRPMALDLAKEKLFKVTVADLNKQSLDKIPNDLPIKKIVTDFANNEKLKTLLKDCDIVLSAVPGFMGFNTLKEIIKAGKNVVDIAFFPEDPFELDALAKQNNVTAVVDCGVAPGMSNLLAGYVSSVIEKIETILIYVGGLPVVREYPFEYKAGFSPIDVIEEYTRPARYIENGKMVIRPALSDPEYIYFPEVGTLEAFNSDGLRTLAVTLNAPNMKEKTLRYPGHIEKMQVLREAGFFSKDEIEINGAKIKPIDITSKLLFPLWELKPRDKEFTVMKVIIEGEKDKKKYRYTYNLLDRHNERTNVHSMARTTGYTATMVLRLLAKRLFEVKGICPPEYIGQKADCVDFILSGLKERGIVYHEVIETI